MEKFADALMGDHAFEIWAAGLIWSAVGILAMKIRFLPNDLNWKKFKLVYWLNDNLLDIFKGFLAAILILRLGDIAVHLVKEYIWSSMPETDDFVVVMILISGAIQYWLHKRRKPISEGLKEKMKVSEND